MQPHRHVKQVQQIAWKTFFLFLFEVWLIYHLLYGHKFSLELVSSLEDFEFSDIFMKLKSHKRWDLFPCFIQLLC